VTAHDDAFPVDAGPPFTRSRSVRLRHALVALIFAALVGGLGWVLLASPWLAVDKVAITGTDRTTPQQVLKAAAVPAGTPLARVGASAVAARVRALPAVADVEVSRGWPRTLELVVTERVAVAGVLRGRTVDLLDGQGVLFAQAPVMPTGVLRLQVDEPGPADPSTRDALSVLGALPTSLRSRLALVRATPAEGVSLRLRDGRRLLWGDPARTADKAAVAEALLRLPGATYDVRSPGVVTRTG
jgi:cell division protein FtsQ